MAGAILGATAIAVVLGGTAASAQPTPSPWNSVVHKVASPIPNPWNSVVHKVAIPTPTPWQM